ncbi:hypothetical protein DEO72_LG5g2599 [Vigna unguiculata]|uniref:Pectinesterase inhibitor domain-containing protein n=1 Tax=Vigna unguiculata TaxID=3917 RepID=A0A4D6M0C4_VIGUN|nr:hypothetical protein DEO72_LG5g2599 [Vigna unguiculata]
MITVSHAPLPASGQALHEAICKETKENEARCLELLKEDPNIAAAKDSKELTKLILKLALKKGTETQNFLKELMKTNPSPDLKQCATTLYDGVVGSFKSALGELGEDDLTASYDAGVAGDGPTTCERALSAAKISDPSIEAHDKDMLLLSGIAFKSIEKLPS